MRYGTTLMHGEITILRPEDKTAKVLFDSEYDFNYWYYPLSELELEEQKS